MTSVLSKCPTCGSRRLQKVRSDFATTVQGRSVLVPDLERQECPDCGEILFDCEAMERLESLRTNKRKPCRQAGRAKRVKALARARRS
jgi:YgiT-type zinc finger domain-containing protein